MNLSLTELSPVIRNTEFSPLTNSLVIEEDEVVTSLTITASQEDSGITLSVAEDLSSVSVSGSYNGLFNDYGEYVSKGSSTKIETPTSFTDINTLPCNKDFYMFKQDSKQSVIVTYTVDIVYDTYIDDVLDSTGLTLSESFTHTVNNSHTMGYAIVGTYYSDNPICVDE
jgi:hypothetical protein